MEENHLSKGRQSLVLENRERLTLTGVREIQSFSEEQVQMNTERGGLLVKGRELKVQKLDVEAGEVAVTGLIYCLNFTDKGEKTQQSLLGKMFR